MMRVWMRRGEERQTLFFRTCSAQSRRPRRRHRQGCQRNRLPSCPCRRGRWGGPSVCVSPWVPLQYAGPDHLSSLCFSPFLQHSWTVSAVGPEEGRPGGVCVTATASGPPSMGPAYSRVWNMKTHTHRIDIGHAPTPECIAKRCCLTALILFLLLLTSGSTSLPA